MCRKRWIQASDKVAKLYAIHDGYNRTIWLRVMYSTRWILAYDMVAELWTVRDGLKLKICFLSYVPYEMDTSLWNGY
jgi:hypothetical protein